MTKSNICIYLLSTNFNVFLLTTYFLMNNLKNNKQTENHSAIDATATTDTRMAKESDYTGGTMRQLFSSILNLPILGLQGLGAQALSRSWWQRWIYPLLFLLTLTLSLATYLTLDSVQQSVATYINDNQRALVGGEEGGLHLLAFQHVRHQRGHSHVAGVEHDPQPSEEESVLARAQGRRVAQLAARLGTAA